MSDKVEVMIIPFRQDASVVMPKKLVEYVLPYAMPLPSSYEHAALIGAIIYKNEKIPIVNLGKFFEDGALAMSGDDGKRRIVIASCIKEHEEFTSYAIVAESAPRAIELSENEVTEMIEEVPVPFYSRVEFDRIDQQRLFVLDLDALETHFFD